jgi:hypothetical protein
MKRDIRDIKKEILLSNEHRVTKELRLLNLSLTDICRDIAKKEKIKVIINHYIKQVNALTWIYYYSCSIDENHYLNNKSIYKKFDNDFPLGNFRECLKDIINQRTESKYFTNLRYHKCTNTDINYYTTEKETDFEIRDKVVNYSNINTYNFGIFPDNDYNIFSVFLQITEE